MNDVFEDGNKLEEAIKLFYLQYGLQELMAVIDNLEPSDFRLNHADRRYVQELQTIALGFTADEDFQSKASDLSS